MRIDRGVVMAVTQEQLEKLFGFAVEFAQDMLQKNGEFYPFGATLGLDGQIAAEGGYDGDDDHPSTQDVYVAVSDRLAAAGADGRIHAAALVANATVPDKLEAPTRDAIRVRLEAEGFARFIYVPYEPSSEQTIRLHDPVLVDIDPAFFPA
jgi:hypothetical protein